MAWPTVNRFSKWKTLPRSQHISTHILFLLYTPLSVSSSLLLVWTIEVALFTLLGNLQVSEDRNQKPTTINRNLQVGCSAAFPCSSPCSLSPTAYVLFPRPSSASPFPSAFALFPFFPLLFFSLFFLLFLILCIISRFSELVRALPVQDCSRGCGYITAGAWSARSLAKLLE